MESDFFTYSDGVNTMENDLSKINTMENNLSKITLSTLEKLETFRTTIQGAMIDGSKFSFTKATNETVHGLCLDCTPMD